MNNLARKNIKGMTKYQPPLNGRAQYQGLLLDFNERTENMPTNIIFETVKYIKDRRLNIYPEYKSLENEIAKYNKVKLGQVLCTNGSSQAIDLIFNTFCDKGSEAIIPKPSFALFFKAASVADLKIISPKYKTHNLGFPTNEVLRFVSAKTKIVTICNPNNPTGTLCSIMEIERIAKVAKNSIILIDEAYFEFSNLSALKLISNYPNIIIIRTFSKAFGLAALRIGYIIASEENIEQIAKVKNPYDVNMIGYQAAYFALKERKEFKKFIQEVNFKSKPLLEKFFKENKIKYFKSKANFILFQYKQSEQLCAYFEQQKIRVRPQKIDSLKNAIRVTIGNLKETKKFINSFSRYLEKKDKIAFIDRDGTLIFEPQDTFQVDDLSQLKILKGVTTGLKKLIKNDYKLVMVTNQDGLGTKNYSLQTFRTIQNELLQRLERNGIKFGEVFVCPHYAYENCKCRKPKKFMVKKFIQDNKIDFAKSLMIGDRKTDEIFAKNLGVKFIKIETNKNFDLSNFEYKL